MNDFQKYDARLVPAPMPLANKGATCWWNSIIQLLLACAAFNQTLLLAEIHIKNNKFAKKYLELYRAARSGMPIDAISDELRAIFTAQTTMNTGGQECANEAVSYIVDLIGLDQVRQVFSIHYRAFPHCQHCEADGEGVRDPRYNIQVPMDNVTDERLRDHIYVNKNELTDYKCVHCGKVNARTYKIDRLVRLNEIIVVCFSKYFRKELVNFPPKLVFNSKSGPSLTYIVVATIHNPGLVDPVTFASSGHYWANVLTADGVMRADDTDIGAGSLEPTESTMMVVYHMA